MKTNIFALALLALLQSCGETGGAAPGAAGLSGGCDPCRVFKTTANHNGDWATGFANGIEGADAACAASATAQGYDGEYKAMIVDGVNRRACTTAYCSGGTSEGIDWVFQGNTNYVRAADLSPIMTTNAGGAYDDTSVGAMSQSFATGGSYWTGLNVNWTSATYNCSLWTESSNVPAPATQGAIGSTGATDASAWASSAPVCATSANSRLICVEQ